MNLRMWVLLTLLSSLVACNDSVEVVDHGVIEKPPEHEQWKDDTEEQVNAKTKAVERKIEVPSGVYEHYPSLVLEMQAPDSEARQYELRPEQDMMVDGFSVEVGAFLPSFVIQGDVITTESMLPSNPALMLDISHQGQKVFTGWLFSEYPELTPPLKEGFSFRLILPEHQQES